jgi:hypothetical protein
VNGGRHGFDPLPTASPRAEHLARRALGEVLGGYDAIPTLSATIAQLQIEAGMLPASELERYHCNCEEADCPFDETDEVADSGLKPDTKFGGTCPQCERWLTYRPLPGGYAPRLAWMNVTCWHCGAGATLDADLGQSIRQPLIISREDIELDGLRQHCREHHRHAATIKLPRANKDLPAWHWNQHHRYPGAHSHFGPYVLVRDRYGSTTGQIPRPLGWFQGTDMKTRDELKAEWLAAHPREGQAGV